MSFVADLWAGKEAISVLADLATLLKLAEEEEDPNLRDLLIGLRSRARTSADRLSQQINELSRELVSLNVNLDLPEQNVGNGLGYLLDLPKRLKLKRLTREFRDLQNNVAAFVDDVEQLLICANRRVDDLETRTYTVRTTLAAMSLRNAPVKEQLETMIKIIEDIGESLR